MFLLHRTDARSPTPQAIGATYVVAAATNQGKDILPRVAARLGAGLASDVVGLAGDGANDLFKRPMWAGNAIATVEVATAVKVVTVRPTEFGEAKAGAAGAVEAFTADPGAAKTKYLKFEEVKSERPELTEASTVVSGGRGTKGDFKDLEALVDVLGAAVGASRAVVDAGWQPNDLQDRPDRQGRRPQALDRRRHLRRHPSSITGPA